MTPSSQHFPALYLVSLIFTNKDPVTCGWYDLSELGRKDDTYKTFSSFAPKYATCTAQFFYPSSFQAGHTAPLHISAKRNSVLGMLFSNENPYFLVDIIQNAELAWALQGTLSFGLGHESITSIPFIALPSVQQVRLLCLTCFLSRWKTNWEIF